MIEYTYSTRKKLIEDYRQESMNKNKVVKSKFSKLYEEISHYGEYGLKEQDKVYRFVEDMRTYCKEHVGEKPSGFLKKNYEALVKLFVPESELTYFYYIIDSMNRFQYSKDSYRRSVRSRDYSPVVTSIVYLFRTYRDFGIFGYDVTAYLRHDMSEEIIDYKLHNCDEYYYRSMNLDDIIMSRIDASDRGTIDAINDILFSDNNTSIITVYVIRAIIKSSNKELHDNLARFMLAAKLQEGVRQAVCENADCGTIEAFKIIFNTIYDNDMIRYAAVKRAIATWTGMCDLDNVDRITKKMLEIMKQCLDDTNKAYEYCKSNDSIEIMIGLWTLGFYEVTDAIKVCSGYIEGITRNQLLTMSYYNMSLEYYEFTSKTADIVIERYNDDFEVVAAYIPTYMSNHNEYLRQIQNSKQYMKLNPELLFASRDEAVKHFEILKRILEAMPKKKLEFKPCIFPWYSIKLSKTMLITRMCILAYAIADNDKIDYMSQRLADIDVSENYSCRNAYLEILLHEPKTSIQRNALINAVADKETYTRKMAYEFVDKMKLLPEEYVIIEDQLRLKNKIIRKNCISLLLKQKDSALIGSVERILAGKKEELRCGALDIVLQLSKDKKRKKEFEACRQLVKDISDVTPKEEILINEIMLDEAKQNRADSGYGLYDVDAKKSVDYKLNYDENYAHDYFDMSCKELNAIYGKLDKLIDEHKEDVYISADGEERLLGNGIWFISYADDKRYSEKNPFLDMWKEFYENEIKDVKTLVNMYVALCAEDYSERKDDYVNIKPFYDYFGKILSKDYYNFSIESFKYGNTNNQTHSSVIESVVRILVSEYTDNITNEDKKKLTELVKCIYMYIINKVPCDKRWFDKKERGYYHSTYVEKSAFCDFEEISHIEALVDMSWWDRREYFSLYYAVDRCFEFKDEEHKRFYYSNVSSKLDILDYVNAYIDGIISMDMVYIGVFDEIGLSDSIESLSRIVKKKIRRYDEIQLERYGLSNSYETAKDKRTYEAAKNLYNKLIDKILEVELVRGDTPTAFSKSVTKIGAVYGTKILVRILTALGKDTFDRSTYYYYGGGEESKSSCLSHLLQVCEPLEGENSDTLKEMIKGSKIPKQRLIETAMYAPVWIDIIGEFLNMPGLRSGCYYFMAHMNERFDDRKKAMIAKYTPLSFEELNDGAFDINWFFECYRMLGEENFAKLYAGAKYISDGNKHSRARKYADAALGKVSVIELEAAIDDKRNKDLLMSYGLVPIDDNKDLIHRYEYIQEFLKQSKQFGSQRQASEKAAVSMALINLASAAGYSDVTRLTLSMECELVKEYEEFFEGRTIGDVNISIQVDEEGNAKISCVKNSKQLKSVPASLKKDDYVVLIKEINTKLNKQQSRTIKMFEKAMEDREEYSYEELSKLMLNPVIKPVVERLVYVCDKKKKCGFISELKDCKVLRIAHPSDMHTLGCWSELQKKVYDMKLKQPFKQVFRELYVKLDEELEKKKSLMFAGNQIQPKKTVACLKSRRWVADYESGLQKIYYKDNIVATIYALADWFSPADIECPTLEWVEFSDRLTYKELTIKDIPPIVYSEVMRDVDLAVSVAHAGGVDPESSHSTIQMRGAIVSYNMELFGCDNVRIEDKHAFIKTNKHEYSVHLGSGVIHIVGGTVVNVLPVHSQSRGKLFLPFVDDDPKTAEIVSKILLFEKDEKIKDPYIVRQIL